MLIHKKLYYDLSRSIFDVGWFPESFEPSMEALTPIAAVAELRISGLKDDDNQYDKARTALCAMAEILLESAETQFLIAIEEMAAPRNRVRSYKGFLRLKSIANGYDQEVEIENGHSIFVGFREIRESATLEKAYELISNHSNYCVLVGDLDEERMNGIVGDVDSWANINHLARIDYGKLMAVAIAKDLLVITIGIDTRGDFVNLRVYGKRTHCERISDCIQIPPS